MFTFRPPYFILTLILFLVEVLIALFLNDRFVRPYVGDFLVVILVYAFLRAFFKLSVGPALAGSLLFAYLVEFMQYLNLVSILGLRHSRLANVVLGNSFEWIDMLAYTLGAATVWLVEKKFRRS